MRVLLLQLDGKLPNIALMRISAHHRTLGDEIVFQRVSRAEQVERGLFDNFQKVYASTIFTRTKPLAERVMEAWPWAVVGGTGWSPTNKIEDHGIRTHAQDYSIYPEEESSIGFTQRGCRLRCPFCVVPEKEGLVTEVVRNVNEIWRGDPWPRQLILLDNDFFGQANWRKRIEELRDGGFKVSFNQGINARMLNDETAEAIASVKYYDDQFRTRRIYTAWDSKPDEFRLFRGLESLVKYGVKPDEIMVYMLIGFWPGETHEDREYRRQRLRDFGCRPYPMAYRPTAELHGYQRWVIRRIDLKVPWEDWKAAKYQSRNLDLM